MKLLILLSLFSFISCESDRVDLAATIEIKANLDQNLEDFTKGKFCADIHFVINDTKEASAENQTLCAEGEVVNNNFQAAIDLNSYISNPAGASTITVQSVKNVQLLINKSSTTDIFNAGKMTLQKTNTYLYEADVQLKYSKTVQTDKNLDGYLKCYNRLIHDTTSEKAHYRCRQIVYGY